ncbi:YegS/Rv2252/BmrU family lipid kinase [Fulvivirga sp. 29W222]|uniref:YegS/Rv2252/BmrU family lipid kinase n=1 Tax=Fulvivirga marina TaxID=2494733 RepID=A0A937FUJ4_9BACT|nr:YegS/Rv2252/BmrU family lipid kinase [Fulvivirga marina]MBL6445192.1 YegS/Rv2252/BmrU family lipid kinase [Fulvivirga marina]
MTDRGRTVASKKKILFIINPKSGTSNKRNIPALLEKHLDKGLFSYETLYTSYAGEAIKISEANRDQFDIIVAIGGDGTINEVAGPLTHSNTILGIIPCGSGNGLARHLKIPRNIKKAIKLLNKNCITTIDTITLDKKVFLNVAGVGFDAHIAQLFATAEKRGFFSYAKLTIQEIRKFTSIDYQLVIDGQEKLAKAPFLISIANSTQYGNNAHIAPNALISDGLMDVCVLRKVPFWYYPVLAYRMFTGTLTKSKYYQTWQGKEVQIKLLSDTHGEHMHIDGDPYAISNIMKLKVNPLSLKVACQAVT